MKKRNLIALAAATIVATGCMTIQKGQSSVVKKFPVPARAEGQKDVLELRCKPLKTVRIGVIGLGMRGHSTVHRQSFIPESKVVALCDLEQKNIDRSLNILKKAGEPPADTYLGENEWKKVCERKDIDLIYINTGWKTHTPMAVYAMEQGKHVALEVPAALTLDECWQLVDTAERTRRHCMMLENCNYDFFETATLGMARAGVFGEIVHAEGAYIHDLRRLNFSDKGYHDMWRIQHHKHRDGNLYPTHGLGPICHIMNIHRGDKMNTLVSLSSGQFGMTKYAKDKFGEKSEQALQEYKCGDMNTSLIKTAKGKTIMVQHDVTSPRPYSRIHMISGTKGFAQKWPRKGIALDPHAHGFMNNKEMNKLIEKHQLPFVKNVKELARKVGGHGGMDFIMDYRLIYCLHHGLPLDQDVYDAAEWSSIAPLSEYSTKHNGRPVEVPDFTRGAWEKLKEVKYYTK